MKAQSADALRLVAWSRIWSPLVPKPWRAEAWRSLSLPGAWGEAEPGYWSTFQVGLPMPPVPLLLHTASPGGGDRAREDWLRAMAHLRLEAQGPTLPPDHLGIACEVLACAVAQGEEMLTRELFRRYLRSWCVAASRRLEGRSDLLAVLPRRFQTDLAALPGVSNEDP